MKVLVPVKRVVDAYVKVQVKSDGTGVETQNVKMSMNPFDEIAMEEAVRLQEQGIVDEVIAVSIGPQACQEILRKALAFGASKALLIETDQSLEPLAVAKVLAKVAKAEQADCILLGKQAIDDDFNQTGQMTAALLDWPQATFASKIEVAADKQSMNVTREIDGGLETLRVNVPCVVSTDLRLNEPRHLGLPNIMKAKKKPLEVKAIAEVEVDITPRLTTLKVAPPPTREAGIMVESVEELVSYLRDKEKVI